MLAKHLGGLTMLFPPTLSLVEGARETQAHCVLIGKDPVEPDSDSMNPRSADVEPTFCSIQFLERVCDFS
jgi:hypothetical protein